jgi:hypothetical protein
MGRDAWIRERTDGGRGRGRRLQRARCLDVTVRPHRHPPDPRGRRGTWKRERIDAGGVLADPGSRLPVIAIDYNRVRGTSPIDPTRPQGESRGGSIWLHMDHGSPGGGDRRQALWRASPNSRFTPVP